MEKKRRGKETHLKWKTRWASELMVAEIMWVVVPARPATAT